MEKIIDLKKILVGIILAIAGFFLIRGIYLKFNKPAPNLPDLNLKTPTPIKKFNRQAEILKD